MGKTGFLYSCFTHYLVLILLQNQNTINSYISLLLLEFLYCIFQMLFPEY